MATGDKRTGPKKIRFGGNGHYGRKVTGDKRTGPKKIRFDSSGHYGRITDERDIHMDKCVETNFKKF